MNTLSRNLLVLSVCLLGSSPVTAEAKPAFAKEVQGDWYVLAAHQNNKNIADDRVGSKVTVTADTATWHDPDAKAKTPLLSATCVRAPAPQEKKQADPNELTSTVSGILCPKQDAKLAARWRITPDNDVLLLLVEVAEYKGNRNGTYSGAAPADVLLICQRKPMPAPSKPDPKTDSMRLVGTWAVLGELDDANCARTRPGGNVEFTAEAVAKHGSYKAKGKPSMEGTWKLTEPQGRRGRIDINFKSGIEGNQGRSPSLYSFHGDDLLMIVYPEGGWDKEAVEKQELRKPPTHFGSDGSRNMWILRRKK